MKHIFPYLLFATPFVAYANESTNITNEFNKFQQQNKQQLEQIQRDKQQAWISQHQYQNAPKAENLSDLSQQCLPYQELKIIGTTLIDSSSFTPKVGECINEARLNKLSQDLTKAYLEKGYIHNPFKFEDDNSGVLVMRVTEGKIAKINSNSSRLNLVMLTPNMIGKALNVKDLDQALDQANRMSGSQVTVDVLPDSEGNIELQFVNEERSRIGGHIGIDNFASKRHQRWQMKGGVYIDSPLGLSDTLSVNISNTLHALQHNFNRSASLFYSLPYGYWNFSLFGAVSQFQTRIPLQYTTAEQKGHSTQLGLKADYTAHRGENHISTLYSQLNYYRNKSYFQGSLIDLQSPTLSSTQFGINHIQIFPKATLVIDVNYERGLTWFNAIRNQGRDQPEGQFNKWNTDFQLSYYYTLNDQLFHHQHNLSGQYSSNYLPAIKQADLLSRYTVRGFNDLSSSAEKSLILQNNFGWVHNQNNWQIEPYLLFDLGIIKNTSAYSHSEKALSYGIGAKIQIGNRASINLEWATGRYFQSKAIINQERSINLSTILRY
ncbi:hemin-binding protein [Pasteurellaceae bacterium 15-036681]|nr:hemin-binding protein [Pasteurellaceae bacterium 15-036681]